MNEKRTVLARAPQSAHDLGHAHGPIEVLKMTAQESYARQAPPALRSLFAVLRGAFEAKPRKPPWAHWPYSRGMTVSPARMEEDHAPTPLT